MFCTNCGKKIYDGDRFCAHCGTKVRGEEAPKPQRQEIVFNPPFKVEAERRTTEIYRGFASEEPEEKPRRVTEPVNFDWNLDGFPAEKKKTEEINFNWDSVVERRNGRRAESRTASGAPVVDRIDIRHPAKEQETEGGDLLADLFVPKQRPERESLFVELPQQTETEEIPVLILPEKPAAEPEKPEIVPAAEPEKPETVPAAVPEPEPEEEPVDSFISVEDLERELFGENYHGLDSMSDDERVKNTAQLEKFYTYNQKNEAFQQLLDREYERLKHMEDQRQPDVESLEYTWAGKLFPAERRTESEEAPAGAEKAEKAEVPEAAKASAEVPAATIDFSPIREEARQKNQGGKEAPAAEQETVPAEEAAAEEEPVPAEEAAPAEEPVPAEEAAPEEEPVPEEEAAPAEEPAECPPSSEQESSEPEEKVKLRYSDIFPREAVADGDDGSGTGRAGTAVSAARLNEAFGSAVGDDEDEDEDEPRRMNGFVKLIILLLIMLILLEGAVLAAKIIAPESDFAVKSGEVIAMIMDRVTGGESGDGESADGNGDAVDADGAVSAEKTYISDIIAEKIEVPASIGQILEDSSLTYDPEGEWAFGEDMEDSKAFENGTWKGEDDEEVTLAEGILKAVSTYYGQWKATNRDTSLIGINKLEIGEIRTGEEGYYVLCRLTFAGAEGEDVIEHVTAYVKKSQDSMVINDIKEEQL